MINPSPTELQFEWKTEDGPSVFAKVTPREGILPSQGFENCELAISPKSVGKFSFALECKTEERVVSLLVQGQVDIIFY